MCIHRGTVAGLSAQAASPARLAHAPEPSKKGECLASSGSDSTSDSKSESAAESAKAAKSSSASVELIATPPILRGTPLQAPTLRSWTRATRWLMVFGCVALANPVLYFFGLAINARYELAFHLPVAVSTAFWAFVAVRRSAKNGRVLLTAACCAVLNSGSIILLGGLPVSPFAAIGFAFLGTLILIPLSLPVGCAFGLLLLVMHDWEQKLRDMPTNDAVIRWRTTAALWTGALAMFALVLARVAALRDGYHTVPGPLALWPALLFAASGALALAAAVRLVRLADFVDAIRNRQVEGLRFTVADTSTRALAAQSEDALEVTIGDGAFRGRRTLLGGLDRSSHRIRSRAALLVIFAAAVGALMLYCATNVEFPTSPSIYEGFYF